jgi:hypothetical protein
MALNVSVKFMGGDWDVSYEPQDDGDILFVEIKLGYATWWHRDASDDDNALRFMSTIKAGIMDAAIIAIDELAAMGFEARLIDNHHVVVGHVIETKEI